MEMGSGFDTKGRKAATKEKRRADDGKTIPSPTVPASLHAAAISLVKLAQHGNATQDPEIGQLLRRQVDGHDEVGGVAGGRQHACAPGGAVERTLVVVHGGRLRFVSLRSVRPARAGGRWGVAYLV